MPNEMISEIWEYVLEPRDVESFALVSKRVYAIGAAFVEEHNKLKREYSFFDTDTCAVSSASLLKKILLWPRVALYITHLSIHRIRDEWEEPPNDDDDEGNRSSFSYHLPYSDDDMELFIEAIRKASFVRREDIKNWILEVKEGGEGPIMALLLLLLPNVYTMTLKNYSNSSYHPSVTFLRISRTRNSPFLTRLTTVNLDVDDPVNDSVLGWESLSIAISIPSVQFIHANRIGYIEIDKWVKSSKWFEPGSSNVKELVLVDSSLCQKSMFQLFESIKGLKKFICSRPSESNGPFEPFWIRSALLAHARYSLESLKVTAEWKRNARTMGSFRGFTKLRELETNVHLFMEKGPFHTLPGLFPVSTESIHLHTSDHDCCDSVLLIVEAFEKAKSHLLPNLSKLTLSLEPGIRLPQENQEIIKIWGKKCWDLGIELSVIQSEKQ